MTFVQTLRYAFGQADEQKIVRAAGAGDNDKVRALMAHGFTQPPPVAAAAIQGAVDSGHRDTAEILITDSLKRDKRFGADIVMKAAARGDTETVTAFARAGFDLRHMYANPFSIPGYDSPLGMAEAYGRTETAAAIREFLPELKTKPYLDLESDLRRRRNVAETLYALVYGKNNGYGVEDKLNILTSASLASQQIAEESCRSWRLLAGAPGVVLDNDRLLRVEIGTLRARLTGGEPAEVPKIILSSPASEP